MTLQDFLAQNSIPIMPSFKGDLDRFAIGESRRKNGWIYSQAFGDVQVVVFGDWANPNVKLKWTNKLEMTEMEKRSFNRAVAEAAQKQKDLKQRIKKETSAFAKELMALPDIGESHSYLSRKQVDRVLGVKHIEDWGEKFLAIPMQKDGEIVNVQKIYEDGNKLFLKGGDSVGASFVFSGNGDKSVAFIGEGYSTCFTAWQALGNSHDIYCAFYCSNIERVLTDIYDKYARVIILVDDDRFKRENAGRLNLSKLMMKFSTISGAIPVFSDVSVGTDFNDMMIESGLDAVKGVLLEAIGRPVVVSTGEIVDEYSAYKNWFDIVLASAKKCKIQKDLMWRVDGNDFYTPVANYLNVLKSKCTAFDLAPNRIEAHFERYELEKEAEYLFDVKDWDGVDRIAMLKDFVVIKNCPFSVFEESLKLWGANVFAKMNGEFVQNRCLIFKGSQGLGKDTLIRWLLESFHEYKSGFINSRKTEDMWAQVTQNAIIHIEEFDQTSKVSVAFLKDIITRDFANFREAYGRKVKKNRCFASFISSVNIDAFLNDQTGSRRFSVFDMESIDLAYREALGSSAQIMAQFHHLWKTGYQVSEQVSEQLKTLNEAFEPMNIDDLLNDIWREMVQPSSPVNTKRYTHNDVSNAIKEMARIAGWREKSVLAWLRKNGFSAKIGGKIWYFAPSNASEVSNDATQIKQRLGAL